MKYMGSKNRIAKHILPIMLEEAEKKGITTWIEPFVGGANVIDKVPEAFERIGYDLNPHTIYALIGVRDFIQDFPTTVSKEEYLNLKGDAPNPITSWIRFHCSFGAKFDGGYASNKRGVNYCMEGRANLQKQSVAIKNVKLICESYENLDFENCLIYCDPPYQGTTEYKTSNKFDHEQFFEWCREQAKKNIVFISEYDAPDDFECVWSGEVLTSFASQRKSPTHNAVEKLFKVSN